MRVSISQDARPQAMTLLIATTISVLLWFIPFAEVLTYPFRLFVTFIHEGGHALATLATLGDVEQVVVPEPEHRGPAEVGDRLGVDVTDGCPMTWTGPGLQ